MKFQTLNESFSKFGINEDIDTYLTEDNGEDSFEAAQRHWGELETPEQSNTLNDLNNKFIEFGFDRVEFSQLIPDDEYNMYFTLTKIDDGENVNEWKQLVYEQLSKLGALNIKFNQADNFKGNAYIHGAFFLDGMTLKR